MRNAPYLILLLAIISVPRFAISEEIKECVCVSPESCPCLEDARMRDLCKEDKVCKPLLAARTNEVGLALSRLYELCARDSSCKSIISKNEGANGKWILGIDLSSIVSRCSISWGKETCCNIDYVTDAGGDGPDEMCSKW